MESSSSKLRVFDLADPSLELLDPNPDIFTQFVLFNEQFFFGKLGACTVEWSKRLTSCAGICQFHRRTGLCTIRLSEPLLKLRPRKNFIETLLHEMIHAYLFITCQNRDRGGHGPEFQYHMHRINGMTGVNITIYHSFHAEVAVYKKHWWRCNGLCQDRAPFFGWVKRAMNRAPGPNDTWWKSHKDTCSGVFIKVKGPEKTEKAKKEVVNKKLEKQEPSTTTKINSVFSHTGHTASVPHSNSTKNEAIAGPLSNRVNNIGFSRMGISTQDVKNSGINQLSKPSVHSQNATRIDSFFKGVSHKLGSELSTIDLTYEDKTDAKNPRAAFKIIGAITEKKKRKKPDIIILGL